MSKSSTSDKKIAFISRIIIGLLCISSPLYLASQAWGVKPSSIKSNAQETEIQAKAEAAKLDKINTFMKNRNIYELRKILQDKSSSKEVRIQAILALRGIGGGAEEAMPELKVELKNKDKEVKATAIRAIQSIDANLAVDELISIFQNETDSTVRWRAVDALRSIANPPQKIIPILLELVKEDSTSNNVDTRRAAIVTLSQMNLDDNAVSVLETALEDPVWIIRSVAADALGKMGVKAKAAFPKLTKALEDRNYTMRLNAVTALTSIGQFMKTEAKPAVPKILAVLNNEREVIEIRGHAAEALGEIDADIKDVLPSLIRALKDTNPKAQFLRQSAIDALIKTGAKLQEKANTKNLSDEELNIAIQHFDEAVIALNRPENSFLNNRKSAIKQHLDALKNIKTSRQFIDNILKNPSIMGPIIYLLTLLAIFYLRPLWLLKFDDFLKPLDLKLPIPGAPDISLRCFVFFKHHPRVLDAWVNRHIKSAREEFEDKNTVQDRGVYIPVPVVLGGKTLPQLTGNNLRAKFIKQRDCLVIQGEGGVGKTSLACQIAKWAMSDDKNERLCNHRMIPVLIEQELDLITPSGKSPLLAAIQGQLQDLTNVAEPISEDLLERLLRSRRIVVIVDHFSEMSDDTRKAIRPESPDFPVNALVVTSRFDEPLGHVTKTVIKPLRIEGNRLSSFMEAYLTQQGKRDLFTDSEFFNACGRLSQMVGQRNITALLAKLYAEQLIAAKVEEVKEATLMLPDNIPNLMLSYLNELNRSVTGDDKLGDRVVHQDAKTIAWECLQHNLRPAPIKREIALAALGGDDAEKRLRYLEYRLRLIQTIGAAQDQIRFALDPLAEYLAALHLIERFGGNDEIGHVYVQKTVQTIETPELIRGFLMALQDCHVCQGRRTKLYEFVEKQLISTI